MTWNTYISIQTHAFQGLEIALFRLISSINIRTQFFAYPVYEGSWTYTTRSSPRKRRTGYLFGRHIKRFRDFRDKKQINVCLLAILDFSCFLFIRHDILVFRDLAGLYF